MIWSISLKTMKLDHKLASFILIAALLVSGCSDIDFSGENAYAYIQRQLEFGHRIPGSQNSKALQTFLSNELTGKGWLVEAQVFDYKGKTLANVIAKNSIDPPEIIIGAHYDTREFSDQDPDPNKRTEPVPGANDGASGTAILLEMASLVKDLNINIWLVFFDAEDQGGINGWEWSIGAQKFANEFDGDPTAVLIVDMVADSDLTVYKEKNSSPQFADAIWDTASNLGYSVFFVDAYKYAIIDDHLPFCNLGIPSVDIIDFDYPYHHTTEDTLDKIAVSSLEQVGKTLEVYFHFLIEKRNQTQSVVLNTAFKSSSNSINRYILALELVVIDTEQGKPF